MVIFTTECNLYLEGVTMKHKERSANMIGYLFAAAAGMFFVKGLAVLTGGRG